MTKNKMNSFQIEESLDETVGDEYDMLPTSTKDLLDNMTVQNPCIDCNKSQHLVESKLISYKVNEIEKSQAYACGHCEYNKNTNKKV